MFKPTFLKTAVLLLATFLFGVQQSSAFGPKPPESEPPAESEPDEPVDNRDEIITFAVNLAILYGKENARYQRLLYALNINSAEDLYDFLDGSADGRNFGKIIARLAFTAALADDGAADALARMGIQNELELREFIENAQNGVDLDFILKLALSQAQIDSKYTRWLEAAGIDSIDDLSRMLNGDKEQTNMQSLLLFIGLHVLRSNPEYQKYAVYIEAALMTLGLTQGMDGSGRSGGSEDDIINLGAFNGMTVGETEEIQYLN